MSFLENNDYFRGDGSRNRKGETLDEFLEKYDAKIYDLPSNTADIIVVKKAKENDLKQVLMVKRSNHPSIGMLATPGGFVDIRENIEDAAARELFEETGVKNLPMMQLRTWGDFDRDPRWRVITTTFLSVIDGDVEVKAGDDAADAAWLDIKLEKEETENRSTDVIFRDIAEVICTQSPKWKAGTWKLTLSRPERNLQATVRVLVTVSDDLLPEEHYEIIENDGVACDHGCLLVQAFLYMKTLGL